MRVNVYAEEMTNRVEIISKVIEGTTFTGLRLYLELPVTVGAHVGSHRSVEGPALECPREGKRDLRDVLRLMLAKLDAHYEGR